MDQKSVIDYLLIFAIAILSISNYVSASSDDPDLLYLKGTACDLTGTWDLKINTDSYKMVITQSGKSIHGEYASNSGTIDGTLNGKTLNGQWTRSVNGQNYAGKFTFKFADDCKSFKGTWGFDQSSTGNSWTGTKKSESGTACDLTGTWNIKINADSYKMVTTQSGKSVQGKYASNSGTIEGILNGKTLDGSWTRSVNGQNYAGKFTFKFADDCKSFKGTWGYDQSSTGNSWTGTK
jgi:hypothetical protein